MPSDVSPCLHHPRSFRRISEVYFGFHLLFSPQQARGTEIRTEAAVLSKPLGRQVTSLTRKWPHWGVLHTYDRAASIRAGLTCTWPRSDTEDTTYSFHIHTWVNQVRGAKCVRVCKTLAFSPSGQSFNHRISISQLEFFLLLWTVM